MAERKRRRLRIVPVEQGPVESARPRPELSATHTVGGILRSARMRRGWQVNDVAAHLKIRRALIEALESDHYEQLPGQAYAQGFVRTYSGLLGLDQDEIVRRFREETSAGNEARELVFPKPIAESRTPTGLVFAVALLVAGVAYGAWYYATLPDREPLPRVAAVPERLAVLAEPPAPAPAPTPPAVSAQAAMLEPTPAPVTSPPPAPAAPSAPIVVETQPAANPPTSLAALPSPAARPENTEAPAIPSAPAAPAAPRVFNEGAGESRIAIRTTADSWVQIRDETGNIVFMRVLRAGDVYNVPNRSGLLLTTGRAGELEIRVDGRVVPPIGRPGAVRRDVVLDPARLAAGTAASETPRPTAPDPTRTLPRPPG
jgi:cytoskeleton protein RodZ